MGYSVRLDMGIATRLDVGFAVRLDAVVAMGLDVGLWRIGSEWHATWNIATSSNLNSLFF